MHSYTHGGRGSSTKECRKRARLRSSPQGGPAEGSGYPGVVSTEKKICYSLYIDTPPGLYYYLSNNHTDGGELTWRRSAKRERAQGTGTEFHRVRAS